MSAAASLLALKRFVPRSWKDRVRTEREWWRFVLGDGRAIRSGRVPVVVVYTMGKVGSTALVTALEAAGVRPVLHVHEIVPANVDAVRRFYAAESKRMRTRVPVDRLRLRLHDWTWKHVAVRDRPAKWITVVRRPLDREVSTAIHNLRWLLGDEYEGLREVPAEIARRLVERMRTGFRGGGRTTLDWFDTELRAALGVDVYAQPFPHEAGYAVLRQGAVELLVLKLETDDAVKERALAEFLGVPGVSIPRANVSAERDDAAAHAGLREHLRLPDDVLARFLDARYTRHFHTPEEIEAMRARWSERTA